MHGEILKEKEKRALVILGKQKILDIAYLAGGTAAALHLGHRYSYDFDFFTQSEFDETILSKQIIEYLPDFHIKYTKWRTIFGDIHGNKFSLFYYKYPLLFNSHSFLGINIADIKDIAVMKIHAISDRHVKRDFIDLFFILNENILNLQEVFNLYDKKYKVLKQNKFILIKSLTYFDEADQDIMPEMIKPVKWSEVKKYFIEEQRKIAKELLEN